MAASVFYMTFDTGSDTLVIHPKDETTTAMSAAGPYMLQLFLPYARDVPKNWTSRALVTLSSAHFYSNEMLEVIDRQMDGCHKKTEPEAGTRERISVYPFPGHIMAERCCRIIEWRGFGRIP